MQTHLVAMSRPGDNSLDFELKPEPVPTPGRGEIRFQVRAFALNQADIAMARGIYGSAPGAMRIGLEGAGIVDMVGEGVTRYQPGDHVAAIPNIDGPYLTGGEYALVQEEFASPWPADWSAEQAAGLWMQHLTPYYPFVEKFPLRLGDWVIITAATGGTGLGSVRLASLLGARVIATTRDPAKEQALRDHGAEVVLSTERSDFVDEVLRVTGGRGVKLINDSLCGPFAETLADCLSYAGNMYIHGALSGDLSVHMPMMKIIQRQAGLHGFSLQNELRGAERLARGRDFVFDAANRGLLPPPRIDSVFECADIQLACDRIQSGRQIGRIVVTVGDKT